MSEERYCYIHNTPTRLSCSACDRPICPKCAVNAAIGYRCKECGKRVITHIEKVSLPRLFFGSISGLIAGIVAGYLSTNMARYGLLVNLAMAYFVGFCIYFAMTKVIGHKIGRRIQVIAASIAVISILYNPILLGIRYGSGLSLEFFLNNFIAISFSCPITILAAFISAWAASRHFNFK